MQQGRHSAARQAGWETSIADFLEVFFRAFLAIGFLILLIRLNGLRSFSEMSAFDFAVTVGTGSVLAATIVNPGSTALSVGLGSLAVLMLAQGILARLRARSEKIESLADNTPLLLMLQGDIIDRNLRRDSMTRADLFGKLRVANALSLPNIHAVVLEATGDVSVLHGSDPDLKVSVDGFPPLPLRPAASPRRRVVSTYPHLSSSAK